jgi:uroporphyrinogen decarboxylase
MRSEEENKVTSRERMLAVVKGETIDRLPVEIHFIDERVKAHYANKLGMTIPELEDYLENDMRYVYTMDEVGCYMQDPDLIAHGVEFGFAIPDPEIPMAYTDGYGITWDASSPGQRPLSHGHDWEFLKKFQMPDPHKPGMFYDFDNKVPGYREKDLCYAALQYYGPLEKYENMRGFENAMMDFYLEPDLVNELLDKITDYRVEMAHQIVERRVVFGHGGDDYGTQRGPMLSHELFTEFIKPRLKKIYGVYKGAGLPVMHHSCGDCSSVIEDLIECGVDCLHPIQASAMDIHELYKRFGDRIVYYGGFDMQSFMIHSTPAQVRDMVQDAVKTLGKNGKMVCAAINITDEIPMDNFKELVDSIKEYRYMYTR